MHATAIYILIVITIIINHHNKNDKKNHTHKQKIEICIAKERWLQNLSQCYFPLCNRLT